MKGTISLMILILSAALALPVLAQTPVEKSWKLLESGLADPDIEQRVKALDALGVLAKDDRARKMTEAALSDADVEVRAQAATTLGEIGLAASIPKLKAALKDTESSVVFSATQALYVMKDNAAYSVYYAVLTGEMKSGDSLMESQMKMLKDPDAMKKMGFEIGLGFIPYGGLGFKAIKSIRQDNVTPVRAAACQKLVNDPDPKSAKALETATTDEKWLVRASALSAIAQRGDAALLPAAVSRLDDEENSVKFNAAVAVIRLSKAKK